MRGISRLDVVRLDFQEGLCSVELVLAMTFFFCTNGVIRDRLLTAQAPGFISCVIVVVGIVDCFDGTV